MSVFEKVQYAQSYSHNIIDNIMTVKTITTNDRVMEQIIMQVKHMPV